MEPQILQPVKLLQAPQSCATLATVSSVTNDKENEMPLSPQQLAEHQREVAAQQRDHAEMDARRAGWARQDAQAALNRRLGGK
jgi:hypothetical protein